MATVFCVTKAFLVYPIASTNLTKNIGKKKLRFLCLTLFILLTTGCVTHKTINVNDIAAIDNLPEFWTLSGRLAFKTSEESFSASLNWQQERENYKLRLSKLIGGTLLQMETINNRTTLEFDNKEFTDSNPERLLRQITGWQLPVRDFKYWITGRLNPENVNIINSKRDEQNRLWSFSTSEGWQVKYKDYKVYSGKALPYNIVLTRQGVTLKLRISDWTIENN